MSAASNRASVWASRLPLGMTSLSMPLRMVAETCPKLVRRAPGEPRAEPEAEQIKQRRAPGEPRAEPEAEQIKQRRAHGAPRAEPEAEQIKPRTLLSGGLLQ